MKPPDLTPLVDLLAKPGTGPVRDRRPIYVDLLPPCNHACPAGENIQAWLAHAQSGRFRAAWRALVEDNPFPAVHGRVCYHPCETHCNRAQLDAAVSIHAVERLLGDLATQEGWTLPIEAAPSGRRVLVVGAGPSGLSAAYHLARKGHVVEIHEAGPVAGGMLHFGIPAYRLPRADLRKEVAAIEAMGVRIVLDHKVDDVLAEKEAGRFDVVFLAIGAEAAKHIDIPACDASRMVSAVSVLRDTATGSPPKLGRRVVVYGAGETAMDAARTARRLGAEEAVIVYRSDPAHMKTRPADLEGALEEGVRIKWLTTIKEFKDSVLTVEQMVLDANGRPQPTGKLETLSADAVVLAVGQVTDSAFLRKTPGIELEPDGTVVVGPNMMTGHPGIFAGGDMVPVERTVTTAVGHGKKAARNIDAWLRGSEFRSAPKHPLVSFESLHLPVYSDAAQSVQATLPPELHIPGFVEVQAGLGADEASYEARRCLSCGNCFECDQCYASCPEQAITIEGLGPGKRYRLLPDRCTGCAVCFDTCPCHAIEMIPEPSGK